MKEFISCFIELCVSITGQSRISYRIFDVAKYIVNLVNLKVTMVMLVNIYTLRKGIIIVFVTAV